MAYKVIVKKRAAKEISKLDARTRKVILQWFKANLSGCENPRSIPNGKPVEGVDGGWRWRIGVYRVLATIDDRTVVVEVFRVGHRRDVYRKIG